MGKKCPNCNSTNTDHVRDNYNQGKLWNYQRCNNCGNLFNRKA